jgi:hypothetical protein
VAACILFFANAVIAKVNAGGINAKRNESKKRYGKVKRTRLFKRRIKSENIIPNPTINNTLLFKIKFVGSGRMRISVSTFSSFSSSNKNPIKNEGVVAESEVSDATINQ